MRFATVLGFTVLAGSLSCAAQNGQSVMEGSLNFRGGEHASGAPVCPLSMHVRQGVGSTMTLVGKDGVRAKMFAAQLKLLLKDLHAAAPGRRMVNATVTAHGLNGAGQILPIDEHPSRAAEVTRSLTVRLATNGDAEVSGDLLLPGFTATLMVDLDSVAYDDGAVWRFAGSSACHAAPDFLMPVGGF